MTFIREELLHPIVSHFPIALLSMALILKIAIYISMTKKYDFKKNLTFTYNFCLITGLIFFITNLFIGDIALEAIKSDLCNLTLAYQHEDMAHTTLILFIIIVSFEVLSLVIEKTIFKNILSSLAALLLIVGNFYLFKTAHQGGQLVYEYGAAVKNYNCTEN